MPPTSSERIIREHLRELPLHRVIARSIEGRILADLEFAGFQIFDRASAPVGREDVEVDAMAGRRRRSRRRLRGERNCHRRQE